MIITKNKLNELVMNEVEQAILNGYFLISSTQMMAGVLSAELTNNHDTLSFNVVLTNNGLNLTKSVNCHVVKTDKYWVIDSFNTVVTDDYEEYKSINKIQLNRFRSRLSNNSNKYNIPVTRKNIQFIHSIKGWKTVPRKNIKMTRVASKNDNSYIIENKKNNHETTFTLN